MNQKIDLKMGDCLEVLKTLPDNSVDSVVTDPPAGIGFMGKSWDSDKGGKREWISWLTEVMVEVKRVLKPGAHGLIWALPRTSHWTAHAIEDAGFEIRDVITHVFGTGFPKSLDISKAIDKTAGAERAVIALAGKSGIKRQCMEGGDFKGDYFISAPNSQEAKQWQGYGTALKPSNERWVLVQKPIGTLDTVMLVYSQLEDIWSQLNAKLATENSKHTIVGLQKDKENTVLENALIHTEGGLELVTEIGEVENLQEQMDMLQLDQAIRTSLNTVSSWKDTLAESLKAMSTSITETKINPIIDFQTLNYLISQITPESIIQDELNQSGQRSSVQVVNQIFSVLRVSLSATQTPFAQENAIEKANSNVGLREKSLRVESVISKAPFSEDIILCRKPLSEKTVAQNVLKNGCGGLNIDASRIACTDHPGVHKREGDVYSPSLKGKEKTTDSGIYHVPAGRFPSNFILSHNPDCKGVCSENCAVSELDSQSGILKSGAMTPKPKEVTTQPGGWVTAARHQSGSFASNEGGASRFFYCSKASKADRNSGLTDLNSHHPTVKSTKLMSYLITMITPPNGVVLDPFMGSGSTGVSAIKSGFGFIGIEKEADYFEISKRRIEGS
jgi:hypothetical protein